jgi:hypothetical protein
LIFPEEAVEDFLILQTQGLEFGKNRLLARIVSHILKGCGDAGGKSTNGLKTNH